jgi:hypothetical protein
MPAIEEEGLGDSDADEVSEQPVNPIEEEVKKESTLASNLNWEK